MATWFLIFFPLICCHHVFKRTKNFKTSWILMRKVQEYFLNMVSQASFAEHVWGVNPRFYSRAQILSYFDFKCDYQKRNCQLSIFSKNYIICQMCQIIYILHTSKNFSLFLFYNIFKSFITSSFCISFKTDKIS